MRRWSGKGFLAYAAGDRILMADNVKKLDPDDVVFPRDSVQARLTDETRL